MMDAHLQFLPNMINFVVEQMKTYNKIEVDVTPSAFHHDVWSKKGRLK